MRSLKLFLKASAVSQFNTKLKIMNARDNTVSVELILVQKYAIKNLQFVIIMKLGQNELLITYDWDKIML